MNDATKELLEAADRQRLKLVQAVHLAEARAKTLHLAYERRKEEKILSKLRAELRECNAHVKALKRQLKSEGRH